MNYKLQTMNWFKKRSRFKVQGCNTEHRTWNIEQFQKGFTAIEVTIIVIVLAILAVSIIVKNPFSTQDYATIAADQLIADIQYVQMRAMGIGTSQSISFRVDSNDYGKYDIPGERKKLSGNITVTSTTFGNVLTFNSLGEPTFGTTNQTISLLGGQTITVYAITGKVE